MSKYSIGIDLGTKSIRSLLVDIKDGKEIASAVSYYKHGIMDESHFDNNATTKEAALQDGLDYKESLFLSLEELLNKTDIDRKDIVGIGIDSTCSTSLPLDKNYNPLSTHKEFENNKNAYVKMWKHHGARKYADEITEYDLSHGLKINKQYGGKTSVEWFFPKLIETYNESKEVYDNTYTFMEVGDYCIYLLTGSHIRSEIELGCKYYYIDGKYLIDDFIKERYPGLINYKEKLNGVIKGNGEVGGLLSLDVANKLGLTPSIPVSSLNSDALVNPLSFNIFSESYLVSVFGTSICNILNKKEFIEVKGVFDIVYNASINSYYSYETGQCACGDILESFINLHKKELDGILNPFDYLNEKASKLRVGESGLIALDSFNGNRSILIDANLSGLIVGLTLGTKLEEIYLCLLESIAFGFKEITDNYKKYGININKILACGGIPKKNPFFMQLLSDVLNMEIVVARSNYSSALASSMYGAYLSGYYKSPLEASKYMGGIEDKKYYPNKERHLKYLKLYNQYDKLYNLKDIQDVMHELKDIQKNDK